MTIDELAQRVQGALPGLAVKVQDDAGTILVTIPLDEENYCPFFAEAPCVGVVERESDGWLLTLQEQIEFPGGHEQQLVDALVVEAGVELGRALARARQILGVVEALSAHTWGCS